MFEYQAQNPNTLMQQQQAHNPNTLVQQQYAQSNLQNAARVASPMELIQQRLNSSVQTAGAIAERLAMVEARMLGGAAVKPQPDGTSPVPTGHIAALNTGFSELERIHQRCDEILARLLETV